MIRFSTLLLVFITMVSSAQTTIYRKASLMGCQFDFTVVADNDTKANEYIDIAINEIIRIENLISEWIPATQVSKINQNAGKQPVKVDRELLELTERAMLFSKISNGAFDISFASIDKIWKFDGSMTQVPDAEAIKKSVEKIGYENIIIDKENSTVFLKIPGMKIGFGSIGKGYAADKAKDLLQSKGAIAGIINASGDMAVWGKQTDGKDWTVGIINPLNKNKIFATFPISKGAVVTSGTYEKSITLNGKKYSHIIDPRTGYPAMGIISVTVFAKSAELANGLSTSIVVMGKEAGLDLINQLPDVSCVIVDDKGQIFYSNAITINTIKK